MSASGMPQLSTCDYVAPFNLVFGSGEDTSEPESGAPRQPSCVRTVVGVASGQMRGQLMRLLQEGPDFSVLSEARHGLELQECIAAMQPELLIVDEALPGITASDVSRMHAQSRLTVLLLVDHLPLQTAAEREHDRRAGLSRLPRSLLMKAEPVGLSHVRTRLQILAARCSDRRRTQTSRSLQGAIDRLRMRVNEQGVRKSVADLVAKPVQAVLLAGGAGAYAQLRVLCAGLQGAAVAVPVLVRVADPEVHEIKLLAGRLSAISNRPVDVVERSMLLRTLGGIVLIPDRLHVVVDESTLRVVAKPTQFPGRALTASMASLRAAGTTVLLSDDSTETAEGLFDVAAGGGSIAVVRAEDCPRTRGPQSVLDRRPTLSALSLDELRWLLVHAVAVRG